MKLRLIDHHLRMLNSETKLLMRNTGSQLAKVGKLHTDPIVSCDMKVSCGKSRPI